MSTSADHARRMSITWDEWCRRMAAGKYPGTTYKSTAGYKAGAALYAETHSSPSPTPTPPQPGASFGTVAAAGVFAGRGIMLGSNRDVWDQAIRLHRDGFCDVVAIIPGTPRDYFPGSLRVVTWFPPELKTLTRNGATEQAEGQGEWDFAIQHFPRAIALNSWTYGRFPDGGVALVELYANEGWGLNFEEFRNYGAQGAKATIPLCGGYSAPGRTDEEAGRIYESLATWSGGRFPGFWMYAGESYLTPQSVAALKAWKPW